MNDQVITPRMIEETLEHLIDSRGLPYVLNQLANICDAKADHIQSNWQDVTLAKAWSQKSWKLSRLAAQME